MKETGISQKLSQKNSGRIMLCLREKVGDLSKQYSENIRI